MPKYNEKLLINLIERRERAKRRGDMDGAERIQEQIDMVRRDVPAQNRRGKIEGRQ